MIGSALPFNIINGLSFFSKSKLSSNKLGHRWTQQRSSFLVLNRCFATHPSKSEELYEFKYSIFPANSSRKLACFTPMALAIIHHQKGSIRYLAMKGWKITKEPQIKEDSNLFFNYDKAINLVSLEDQPDFPDLIVDILKQEAKLSLEVLLHRVLTNQLPISCDYVNSLLKKGVSLKKFERKYDFLPSQLADLTLNKKVSFFSRGKESGKEELIEILNKYEDKA